MHQINLPKEVTDNELQYLDWIFSVVTYSNPHSQIRIDLLEKGYNVTITPDNPEFRQKLIDNILEIHRRFKLKITYSKSLKISKKVSFFLEKSDN